MNGLFSNLRDNEFISFVHTFEIVCFVKTFMTLFQSNAFVDYFVFTKPVIKLSKQGRYAWGIVCLLRKEYFSYVRQLDVVCSNMLLFLIDKDLFGVTKGILYVCVYVPPEGSPFYPFSDLDYGIGVLEECLTDCYG